MNDADVIAKIHAAMEKTDGNATQAAVLLGCDRQKLYNAIHGNAELKARWSKGAVEPPTEAVQIHRPPPPEPIGEKVLTEEEIARALAKEDQAMQNGLEKCGVKGDSLKLAVALAQFQGRFFSRSIEMVGGGVNKLFLDLMVEVQKITNELDAGGLAPEREKILREDRAFLIESVGRTYDRVNKAALTQAMIKFKIQAAKNGQAPAGKPGFSPMIQANNVQINTKQ